MLWYLNTCKLMCQLHFTRHTEVMQFITIWFSKCTLIMLQIKNTCFFVLVSWTRGSSPYRPSDVAASVSPSPYVHVHVPWLLCSPGLLVSRSETAEASPAGCRHVGCRSVLSLHLCSKRCVPNCLYEKKYNNVIPCVRVVRYVWHANRLVNNWLFKASNFGGRWWQEEEQLEKVGVPLASYPGSW